MLKKKLVWVLGILMIGVLIIFFIYHKWHHPASPVSPEDRAAVNIMPIPASLKLTGRKLALPVTFDVYWNERDHDPRLDKALQRFTDRLGKLITVDDKELPRVPMNISCSNGSADSLLSVAPEGYQLKITPGKIIINAGGYQGVLHALETLLQLVNTHGSPYIPTAVIEDQPRYPWRGLMIDVCRHWIPKEVILQNLDAMAAVKMNVLHLHLSEYQAFRIESTVFPLLQEKGSAGHYFTQEDIRDIISYASDRGIRVIPEFDLPGHCTSWFAGYPELATVPGIYQPDTTYGVLYPLMDPTKEGVYIFLDRFFGEMATLFPDPYVHIGGDEVNPKQWDESPHVQKFMKEHNLADDHALQNYFNIRLEKILEKHGKKMMGWDEILNASLPNTIVVQSWRNQKSLFRAVQRGGRAILSAGYYLDHKLPAGRHYEVDPEILPGAVDIEPDSLHWKTYALTLNAMGSNLESSLTLFGLPGNYRGVISFLDNLQGFPEATEEEGTLIFTIHSDYGKIKFSLTPAGDSIYGKGSLGVVGIDVQGTLTGGDNVPGTKPPVLERIKPLTAAEKSHILGGEACMWSEVVNAMTIDSRIWPRAAAIAEKLWSPASLTKDEEDMYRRLWHTDSLITVFGMPHHANYIKQLKTLAGGDDITALKSFVDILEEVKYYDRLRIYDPLTVSTPLNKVVDAAWPESYPARDFNLLVTKVVTDPQHEEAMKELSSRLQEWSTLSLKLKPVADLSTQVAEVMPLADLLSQLSDTGLKVLQDEKEGTPDEERVHQLDSLANAAITPLEGVLLAVQPGFRQLADQYLRKTK